MSILRKTIVKRLKETPVLLGCCKKLSKQLPAVKILDEGFDKLTEKGVVNEEAKIARSPTVHGIAKNVFAMKEQRCVQVFRVDVTYETSLPTDRSYSMV